MNMMILRIKEGIVAFFSLFHRTKWYVHVMETIILYIT